MSSKRKKNKKTPDEIVSLSDIKLFEGLSFYILPNNFGSIRLKLISQQIKKYHGSLLNELSQQNGNLNYIIVEETVKEDIIKKTCNFNNPNLKIARCSWISKCIEEKKFLDISNEEEIVMVNNIPAVKKDFDSLDTNSSCNLEYLNQDSTSSYDGPPVKRKKLQNGFVCAFSSGNQPINLNKHITDELEKLSSTYKSKNDTWRALGYQKAIAAIKKHSTEIRTWEEARNIRCVGERLADKIMEIVASGKLRKVEEVCEGEEAKTLKLFMGVWGAGPTTAQNWYVQGFRSLEDLKTKASLTQHQKVGLKYYEDLNDRIPRAEAALIEEQVKNGAAKIQTGLKVVVCGSYRRGHATCGDVDVLITHSDGVSHKNVFKPLLALLKSTGFITDDLVTQEHNGNQCKYLGVCKLPGDNTKYRRLDIIVVPYTEYAPALMYFTGSAHCNRSMRLLATKMGMSLSEHGLKTNIIRQGREKLNDGNFLDTPTEESIFEHLGLKYRPPNERDH